MTKWANDSQRFTLAKDSILALFASDPSPKAVEEIHKALSFPFGKNTIRQATKELEKERRLFQSVGRANIFIFRLPDVKTDRWWLKNKHK